MAQQALVDGNCYDQNSVCMGMCRTYIDDIFNNCDNEVSYLGQASKANSLYMFPISISMFQTITTLSLSFQCDCGCMHSSYKTGSHLLEASCCVSLNPEPISYIYVLLVLPIKILYSFHLSLFIDNYSHAITCYSYFSNIIPLVEMMIIIHYDNQLINECILV